MAAKKKAFFLLTAIFISASVYADIIEQKGKEPLECVVLSENEQTIECAVPIGKLSIPREIITKITRLSSEENQALRKKWKEQKIVYRSDLLDSQKPYSKIKGGEHIIRYGQYWVTLEEYKNIKEKEDLKKEELLKSKMNYQRQKILEEKIQKQREAVIETIAEGEKTRSVFANELLENKEWNMAKTPIFTVFYHNAKDSALADNLQQMAGYYFSKIKQDLSFNVSFLFRKQCEIFLINDLELWTAIQSEYADKLYVSCAADYYKKEFFLFSAETEKNIRDGFLYQFSELFLYEFEEEFLQEKQFLPLWFKEGFSLVQSADQSIYTEDFFTAVKKDYHLKLDELLAIDVFPEDETKKNFFSQESRALVEFFYTKYGSKNLYKFIMGYVTHLYSQKGSSGKITRQTAKQAMKNVIAETFLHKDYAGYASLDDAWRFFILEKGE